MLFRSGPEPMVRVAQGDAADAMDLGEFDCPTHAGPGIDDAETEIAVPVLEGAEAAQEAWLRIHLYIADIDTAHQPLEAVDAVSIGSLELIACHLERHFRRMSGRAAAAQQYRFEPGLRLGGWYPHHRARTFCAAAVAVPISKR